MPFDGTDVYDNNPLAKLGAVERLLATEQQWCKGRLRDAHGRHCLVGAIEAVGGRQALQKVVLQAAREVSGKRYWRIEFFNDDPRTTHADVLQVLRRARQNLVAGMIGEYTRQPLWRRWTAGFYGRGQRYPEAIAIAHQKPEGERYMPSEPRQEHVRVLELQE
jgi:hypothetical protein